MKHEQKHFVDRAWPKFLEDRLLTSSNYVAASLLTQDETDLCGTTPLQPKAVELVAAPPDAKQGNWIPIQGQKMIFLGALGDGKVVSLGPKTLVVQ